jgi:hypothetical protein
MKTYARYKYTTDYTAKRIGNRWIEVTREYVMYYPSGRQSVVVLQGVAVKARHCEIIQVF